MRIRIPVCELKLGKRELDLILDCVKSSWISSRGNTLKVLRRFSMFPSEKYWAIEMMLLAGRNGVRIKEVPIETRRRTYGTSIPKLLNTPTLPFQDDFSYI